jgi:hypothetical protein
MNNLLCFDTHIIDAAIPLILPLTEGVQTYEGA